MKEQTPVRIAQLKADWPAIEEMLRLLDGHGMQKWPHGADKDRIHIFVKRADADLLIRQPQLYHGYGQSTVDSNRKGQVGKEHEVYCAVSADHHIRSTIGFWDARRRILTDDRDRVRDLFRKAEENHANHMAMVGGLLDTHTPPSTPAPAISYLVQMNVVYWHKQVKDYYSRGMETSHGEFIEREITFFVYRAPKGGFTKLLDEADVTKNVRLNINDICDHIGQPDDPFKGVMQQIDEFKARFVSQVYLKGLGKMICGRSPGMSGVFGETKVVSYVFCGNVLLTFSKGDDDITFVGEDGGGDPRFGLQAIDSTLPAARAMVEEVIAIWSSAPKEAAERFRPNEKVKIL